MSASGISDANPVMPASWAPAHPDDAPRPAPDRRRDADSDPPAPRAEAHKPANHRHKVDVRV